MVRHHCTKVLAPRRIPHPRGDGPALFGPMEIAAMYSPPAWGWSDADIVRDAWAGVFPTRVGMVRSPRFVGSGRQSIPHPRGDGPRLLRDNVLVVLYSPPAWGWSVTKGEWRNLIRVFPTRVGMVRASFTTDHAGTRIPHPRGDGPKITNPIITITAYSPPAWGWSERFALIELHDLVFPTRVGMVRNSGRRWHSPLCIPHPRGDGPIV